MLNTDLHGYLTDMAQAHGVDETEFLAAFASGELDRSFALLIETQATLRPGIAQAIGGADALAGLFFEREPKAVMSDGALDRMLSRLDEPDRVPPITASEKDPRAQELIRLPDPLRLAAQNAMSGKGWQSLGRGLSRLPLDVGGDAECELIRMEPGSGAPRHAHRGHEYTLCVLGGFSDAAGTYAPGDLAVAGPEDVHQPIADDDGVCVALAVRTGGLQFTGMMGLIQRALGK